MTREELATALDISRGALSKLEKRGMPIDSVERARRWRKRHLQPGRMKGVRRDTISEIDASNPLAKPEALPVATDTDTDRGYDPEDAIVNAYKGARERKEHYQAEMARMAFERESGKLMLAESVVSMMANTGSMIRLKFEQLPFTLAPLLVHINDESQMVTALMKEFDAVLSEMSRQFKRFSKDHANTGQAEIEGL